MDRLTVTLDPRRGETRVLMMEGRDERLRAVLGPARAAHPRAATTLLEALALWQQRAVSCVLCADVEEPSSALRPAKAEVDRLEEDLVVPELVGDVHVPFDALERLRADFRPEHDGSARLVAELVDEMGLAAGL